MNDNFKAITAMILAVLCVTIMSVQAKLIGIEYHPVQIAFARAIVVLILLSPIISVSYTHLTLPTICSV